MKNSNNVNNFSSFKKILFMNLKRRTFDGFAFGYNLIFPFIIIGLLGFLTKNMFEGEISSQAYYTVVTVPYTIVMGVVTAAYAGKDDAFTNTAIRILCAPVSVLSIVLAKIIACTIVFFACSTIVFITFGLISGIPFKEHVLLILALFFTTSLVTSSVGTLIGLGMKNFMKLKNVLTIPICVLAMLAGCFFPLSSSGMGMNQILLFSPFTWINRSIFQLIYEDTGWLTGELIFVFFIIALLAGLLSCKKFKKEEYMYGELPGMEK